MIHTLYRIPPILLVLAGWLVGSGCERPFVEPRRPEVEILEPDTRTLFTASAAFVRATATSFRDIERLELEGTPMNFNEETAAWEAVLQLTPGLNAYTITAFDVADVPGSTTLRLAYLPYSFSDEAPALPAGRGHHTATLLDDGSLLVLGGAPSLSLSAAADAFLLPPGGEAFTPLPNRMGFPRLGHVATPLPDGRVLILGGAFVSSINETRHFVTTPEIYDPSSRTFSPVVVDGIPIRRAYHSAFVNLDDEGILVDLFGGLGPSEETDQIVPRRDFLSYRFVDNTLFSLGLGGDTVTDVDAVYGQAQVTLAEPGPNEAGRYLVTGTNFRTSPSTGTAFALDFNTLPIGVDILPDFRESRTFHAGTLLQDSLAVFFGGTQNTGTRLVTTSELYSLSSNQFYRFPNRAPSQERFGHTATKMPSGRIVLVGGFSLDGQALDTSEFFDAGLAN